MSVGARAAAAALRAAARAGDAEFAREALACVPSPQAEHVRAAVAACSRAGRHAEALRVYRGARPAARDARSANAAAAAAVLAGDFGAALAVLREMDESGWRVEEKHLKAVTGAFDLAVAGQSAGSGDVTPTADSPRWQRRRWTLRNWADAPWVGLGEDCQDPTAVMPVPPCRCCECR